MSCDGMMSAHAGGPRPYQACERAIRQCHGRTTSARQKAGTSARESSGGVGVRRCPACAIARHNGHASGSSPDRGYAAGPSAAARPDIDCGKRGGTCTCVWTRTACHNASSPARSAIQRRGGSDVMGVDQGRERPATLPRLPTLPADSTRTPFSSPWPWEQHSRPRLQAGYDIVYPAASGSAPGASYAGSDGRYVTPPPGAKGWWCSPARRDDASSPHPACEDQAQIRRRDPAPHRRTHDPSTPDPANRRFPRSPAKPAAYRNR